MPKAEFNERATSPGFWALIGATVFAMYALSQLVAGPDKPSTSWPSPTPTVVTGTVVPTPLCTGPTMGQCWETTDEDGPPWYWREKARVR